MNTLKAIKQFAKFAWFSEAKVKTPYLSKPQTLMINQNLRFAARQFEMFILPSHPKILTKGHTFFQIDVNSQVIELAFVGKSQNTEQLGKLWGGKTSFQFTFSQLQQLLDVQVGSNLSVKIQKDQICAYQIKDIQNQNEVEFVIEYTVKEGKKDRKIRFERYLSSSDFRTLQEIIKDSLYDLSGLGFIFQARKRQQLNVVKKEIKQFLKRQEQKDQYFGQ